MLTSITPGSGATRMTFDARIGRRRVALDLHRQADLFGRRVSAAATQFEIVLEPLDRRHEDAQVPVARLDRHRGADGAVDVAEPLLDPLLLACLRRGERGDALGALARLVKIRQRPARLGRVGLDDIREGRRAERRAARPAADDSRPGCRRERDGARRGGSSIFRCASDARRPSPASAGPAARIPDGSVRPREKTRAIRCRSSGSLSLEFSGETFGGQVGFLHNPLRRILVSRRDDSRARRPSAEAIAPSSACALLGARAALSMSLDRRCARGSSRSACRRGAR